MVEEILIVLQVVLCLNVTCFEFFTEKWCYLSPQDDFLGKLVSLSTQPEHESFVLDARHDSIVVCHFVAIVHHCSSLNFTYPKKKSWNRITGS